MIWDFCLNRLKQTRPFWEVFAIFQDYYEDWEVYIFSWSWRTKVKVVELYSMMPPFHLSRCLPHPSYKCKILRKKPATKARTKSSEWNLSFIFRVQQLLKSCTDWHGTTSPSAHVKPLLPSHGRFRRSFCRSWQEFLPKLRQESSFLSNPAGQNNFKIDEFNEEVPWLSKIPPNLLLVWHWDAYIYHIN